MSDVPPERPATSPLPYPDGYAPPAWSTYEYAVHGGLAPAAPPRRRRAGRTALLLVPSAALLVGVGVVATVLVEHGHTTTSAAGAAAGATQRGGGTTKAAHPVTGVVTAEQGAQWSVKTSSGSVLTVQVGAHTRFGTRAQPSSASAIPTGSTVAVTGTTSGDTLHATRIRPAGASQN